MKYNIVINQKICVEQEITFKAGALLDLFGELSTWANPAVFEDGIYYQLAYNKILTELPLVFKTKDTMYRFVKELKDKGLIEQRKKGKNLVNFIRLSAKGKDALRFGKKPEAFEGSEKNPTTFGKISEAVKTTKSLTVVKKLVQGSEKNPTYNNTTTNNNIYIDFLAYQFLKKNAKEQLDVWEMQNKKTISDYKSFLEYFEIKVEEEELEFTINKLLGRLKRLKYNWRGDSKNASFNDQPIKKAKRIG
jgi:hypothetical protein